MTMRLEMEREVLSKFKRLPGLPSSFVGLETILGTDEDIDFEDYLNGMIAFVVHCSLFCRPQAG